MESFKEFLIKNKLDEQLNESEEQYFSINEDGSLDEIDEDVEDVFGDIADEICREVSESKCVNEDKDSEPSEGWGGEVYCSLDFKSLDNEQVDEADKKEKEDSNTLKTLLKRKEDDNVGVDKVARRNTKYKIADDGKNLEKINYDTLEYEPLTDEQIQQVLDQKNKISTPKTKRKQFAFDGNEELCVVDGEELIKLPLKQHKKFIKTLNDIVNSNGIHYRFADNSSKMLINTTSWTKDGEEENIRDKDRFNNAEYAPLNDKQKEDVLSIVNKVPKTSSKSKEDKKTLGYQDNQFTYDGKPLTSDELKKLVSVMNGNVGMDTKLLNPKAWGKKTEKYWESYKISVAGSKIGDAINFNLPPVVTCNKDVPCIRQGCYAIKAFQLYPSARAAMECNLALLKRDDGFKLFKKSMILALNTPKKGDGKKFNLCRIHVNGDMISTEYLQAICDVVSECPHVNFWMYTKQYEMLSAFSGKVPNNLCIIVSCWGEFNPFDYKDGKYSDLALNYPLAYLDDETEEVKALNQKIQQKLGKPKDIQVCPCTEAEEIITRCEKCKICFDRSLANNNLVFKKH